MYTNPAISSLGILVLQIGRQSLLDSLSYRAQEQKDTRASELVSLVLAQVPLLTKVQRTDILQSCICILKEPSFGVGDVLGREALTVV